MECVNNVSLVFRENNDLVEFCHQNNIKCISELKLPKLIEFFSKLNIIHSKRKEILLLYRNKSKDFNEIDCKKKCIELVSNKKQTNKEELNTKKSEKDFTNNSNKTLEVNQIKSRINFIEDIENEFYQVSKFTCISMKTLIITIYEFVKNTEREIYFNDIFFHLRKAFAIKKINRNNLRFALKKYLGEFSDFHNLAPRILEIGNLFYDDLPYTEKIFASLLEYSKVYTFDLLLDIFNKELSKFTFYIENIFSNDISKINRNYDDEEIKDIFVIFKSCFYRQDELESLTEMEYNDKLIIFKKRFIKYKSTQKAYKNILKILSLIKHEDYDIELKYIFPFDAVKILKEKGIQNLGSLIKNLNFEIVDACYEYTFPILKVLNDIKTGFNEMICQVFYRYLSRNQYIDGRCAIVIKMRANGKTFDEIGQCDEIRTLIGKDKLTRERIRQIEKKVYDKFLNTLIYENHDIVLFRYIKAKVKNPAFITRYELKKIFGDLTNIFIYFIKKINCEDIEGIEYIADLDCLNLSGLSWYDSYIKLLVEIPSFFEKNKLDKQLKYINEHVIINNIPLSYMESKEVFLNQYTVNGNYYCKNKINTEQKYALLIEKYFPKGINIYSESDLNLFRKYYHKEFDDKIIDNQSNRALSSNISKHTILVGKGMYNLSKLAIKLDIDELKKINAYINDAGNIISYNKIFYIFKNMLWERGITNRYQLQGLLRYQLGNQYYYSKDYLSKEEKDINISKRIIKCADEYEGFINVDDFKKDFRGIQKYIIENALYISPNYIKVSNGRYINVNYIKIGNKDIDDIRQYLRMTTSNKTIKHLKDIYSYFTIMREEFMKNNQIDNSNYLYNILKYFFSNNFNFKYPFITSLKTEILNINERIEDFVFSNDILAISDLRDYIEENNLRLNGSMQDYLLKINNDYLRVDDDLIVKKTLVNLSSEIINHIEHILKTNLSNTDKINISKIKNYERYFPTINYQWNHHLLASIIESDIKSMKVITTNSNYLNTEYIIILNDSKFNLDKEFRKE